MLILILDDCTFILCLGIQES